MSTIYLCRLLDKNTKKMLKFNLPMRTSFRTSPNFSPKTLSFGIKSGNKGYLLDFRGKIAQSSLRSTISMTVIYNSTKSDFLCCRQFVRHFAGKYELFSSSHLEEKTNQTVNGEEIENQNTGGRIIDLLFDGTRHLFTLFAASEHLLLIVVIIIFLVGLGWCFYTLNQGLSSSQWQPVEADVLDGEVYVWSHTR